MVDSWNCDASTISTLLKIWDVGNWSVKLILIPSAVSLEMFLLCKIKFINETMYSHGRDKISNFLNTRVGFYMNFCI
jgi:hypothetical protein